MPSSHDLKQDETILKLSRRMANLARKMNALSNRLTLLDERTINIEAAIQQPVHLSKTKRTKK